MPLSSIIAIVLQLVVVLPIMVVTKMVAVKCFTLCHYLWPRPFSLGTIQAKQVNGFLTKVVKLKEDGGGKKWNF
jgi:hypothetical protein